jgi:hypothetical protein
MSDNLPVGECATNSLNGRCGQDCPVFLDGDCPIEDEIRETPDEPTPDPEPDYLGIIRDIVGNL